MPACSGEALDGGVGEADVEDRVHHARHGELGTGADRDQERVVGLAELLAHAALERVEVRTHLVTQCHGLPAALQVDLAGLGGDGEARRHRKTEIGHLREVRAFSTEEVLEVLVPLGEVVDELHLLNACTGLVGLAAVFVYQHGSRLLEDAMTALTARNIPRSRGYGYVRLRTACA
ncbi:hypothetical protein M2169_004046 [Streptomyces sp. MJP52]|nr:hypothetical protein [Streptomyces sp. MJP52]